MMELIIACITIAYFACAHACNSTEHLVARGNKIYKSGSNVVWSGKGVNLPHTRACFKNGCERSTTELTRRIDYLLDDVGLDWIRLLLEAYDTNDTVISNSSYWQDIQHTVDYIGSKPGKYVEVTLFADPSLGADPKVPGGPSASTTEKWVFMAEYFKDMPHVIIGIVNEPQSFQSTFGSDESLRNSMNSITSKIRETGATNLILVQCLAFSADCNLYARNRISVSNVAYELHLYCTSDEADTKLSPDLPFVVSEIGIVNNTKKDIVEDYLSFRYIVALCQRREIPYAGWCFDETCGPVMIEGQATHENGCGKENDLSNQTAWGKLFLQGVPCEDEYCDGASAPVPALGPLPSVDPKKEQECTPSPAPMPVPAPASTSASAPMPVPAPASAPTPTLSQSGVRQNFCLPIAYIVGMLYLIV